MGIRDRTKTFQGKTALNQLNCVVRQGEIYGFLGPSGAGKTTTIKLLTGQLSPQSGELTVLGQPVVCGCGSLYSQIGVLTDTSGFYEKMTVRENPFSYTHLDLYKRQDVTQAALHILAQWLLDKQGISIYRRSQAIPQAVSETCCGTYLMPSAIVKLSLIHIYRRPHKST